MKHAIWVLHDHALIQLKDTKVGLESLNLVFFYFISIYLVKHVLIMIVVIFHYITDHLYTQWHDIKYQK